MTVPATERKGSRGVTIEELVQEALDDKPRPMAVIMKAVADRAGVFVARPTISGALYRLAARSQAAFVDDDAGKHPRRWYRPTGNPDW
jgi:hypothetical protein